MRKFFIYFILACTWILCLEGSIYALNEYNIPSYERQALYDLYYSTNGNNWIYQEGDKGHWDFKDPEVNPCLASNPWQGLNCTLPTTLSSSYYYISEIKLSKYNLNGTIPDSISDLIHLQYLNLSHNLLYNHPPLPDRIGNLSKLIYLDLSYNSLLGYLPDSFYNLSALQYVDFTDNVFQGKINNSIDQLTQLQVLNLGYNRFEGLPSSMRKLSSLNCLNLSKNVLNEEFPYWIKDLSNLTYLNLAYCGLTGTIPSTLSLLTRLQYLNLGGTNELIGTIPSELGELSLLESLYLNGNYLSGTIPSTFINMNYLTTLSLAANNLNGTLPYWLGDLLNLTYISLEDNQFIGTIPITLSYLKHLKVLSLDYNILTGMIPDWIGTFSELKFLSLGENRLTNTIPFGISKLISLQEIYLYRNLLTGTIPNIFHNLSNLTIMEFQGNYFIGSLPVSISSTSLLNRLCVQDNHLTGNLNNVFNAQNQKYMAIILLSNNHFTGKLPEEVFKSQILHYFAAVGNCFDGPIPSIICNNTLLKTLVLDGSVCASSCRNKIIPIISSAYTSQNEINGGIPKCLWSMPVLSLLHLSGNGLTGSFPDDIELAKSLTDLSLSYNLLTGTIPIYIQDRKWDNLDLSHNRFSGTLRSDFASQYKIASLSLKNNRISGYIPNQLKDMRNISILEGNSFDCKYDRSDLPANDDYKDTYECGSDSFNLLYYIWLGLFVFIIFIILLVWYYRDQINEYISVSDITQKILKWINILSYINVNYEIEMRSKINKVEYFKLYHTIYNIISKYSLYCTILIIVILLPLYVILNVYYAVQTYEYAWIISIQYLSGNISFGIIFCLLILFAIIQFILFHFILQQYKNNQEQYKEEQIYRDNKISYNKTNKMIKYSLYLLYVLINFIVVGGVNIAYVYVVLYQSNTIVVLAQILLSIFKMVWNNFISPKMVNWIINYLSETKSVSAIIQRRLFILMLVVSLLNNIVIPCIIVAIVSPNCFYHVFEQESDVTSSFVNAYCTTNNEDNKCIEIDFAKTDTSYSPPFIYSYQCSADFITYYASVFVLTCILSTFIVPLVQMIILQLLIRYKWMSEYIQLPILLDLNSINNEMTLCSIISLESIYRILISLLTLIGLLLTFGVVFPPLAVAFLITIYRRIYFHKAILGRYISHAMEQKAYKCLDIINEDCKMIPLLSTLQLCGLILLYLSCTFYTLFVFDILGGDVGIVNAYWVLIVMPCIPICIHIIYKAFKYSQSYTTNSKSDNINIHIDVELTPAISLNTTTIPIQLEDNNNMISNPLSNIMNDDSDQQLSVIKIDDIYVEDREGNSIYQRDNKYEYNND